MRSALLAIAGACAIGLGVSASSFAAGTVDPGTPVLSGAWSVNAKTGAANKIATAGTRASTDFGYYNELDVNSAANAGISLPTADAPEFGDEIFWDPSANLGTLDDFWLTIYNSSSGGNTGSITGGILNVGFFRKSDNSEMGGFSADLSSVFGGAGALNAGFYTIIEFSNLATLLGTPINLDTTDMVVLQQFAATGTSTRNGIVSFNPTDGGNLGSSPLSMFEGSNNVPPGFYNFGNPQIRTDPGYLIGVIAAPEPASIGVLALAGMGLMGRRRK